MTSVSFERARRSSHARGQLRNESRYVSHECQGRIIGIPFECAQGTAKFAHLIECQVSETNASRLVASDSGQESICLSQQREFVLIGILREADFEIIGMGTILTL